MRKFNFQPNSILYFHPKTILKDLNLLTGYNKEDLSLEICLHYFHKSEELYSKANIFTWNFVIKEPKQN